VADGPGRYTVDGVITETSGPDARPSDNTTALTVVLTEGAVLSPARLTPARPKAGALVAATVLVTSAGKQVRPTRVSCAAAIGGSTIRGVPKATVGSAICSFRPPRSAKGKILRGKLSVGVSGETLRRPFSVKLG
jgi:hypothetical protein